MPILRLTLEDGTSGFGAFYGTREQAAAILGVRWGDVFLADEGVPLPWRAFDYPLWDLAGQLSRRPVYALAAAMKGHAVAAPYRVPCYDTSLYFDDLHLPSTEAAAELLAAEAREGLAAGHRAFKIKVGRGARHMAVEAGTQRDIAIVRAVREAVGPTCPIMLDANNGYTLNLAKRVLAETAECAVVWLEEAFHEDRVLYEDLRAWLADQGLAVLIADGEGQADPRLLDWARAGVVDVVQYDIFHYGFTGWWQLGGELDRWSVRSAPHHYGGHYGNYAAAHLAGSIQNFTFVEWDEAVTPGLDAANYAVVDGNVHVPDAPGFGLALDEAVFQAAVGGRGYGVGVP